MAENICFFAFAGVTLLAACVVVFARQPLYSVLSLLVVMFSLAAMFVMLGAYLVAALQVLLYAGAVLVLFLFVMMLLNLEPEALARMRLFTLRGAGLAVGLAIALLLIAIVRRGSPAGAWQAAEGTVESLGTVLLRYYVLPFELTSFLILAAIIGAVSLAKTKHD